MRARPWVAVPADCKQVGPHPFQAVGEKYLRALIDGADVVPIPLPSLHPPLPLTDILSEFDGLFLTGSHSNIEPHHYSNEPSWEGNLHDPARDANTLGLVRRAVDAGLPVLAVCRGLQEVNVAFGGTLHQKVHEVTGYADHREDKNAPLDQQYAPAHLIRLEPGGILHGLADGAAEVWVNSLHGQGIAELAPTLAVEARAPDGLIEAVRLPAAQNFFLAVQWHPEWKVTEDPFYLAIYRAFGDACSARKASMSRNRPGA